MGKKKLQFPAMLTRDMQKGSWRRVPNRISACLPGVNEDRSVRSQGAYRKLRMHVVTNYVYYSPLSQITSSPSADSQKPAQTQLAPFKNTQLRYYSLTELLRAASKMLRRNVRLLPSPSSFFLLFPSGLPRSIFRRQRAP